MSKYLRSGARHLVVGVLLASAVACGGTPPGAGPAGNGSDVDPSDPTPILQAALDKLVAAKSYTFTATMQDFGAVPYKATATGTVRTAPVAASVLTWVAVDGTTVIHLIDDGELWIDGGDGNLVSVGAVSDSIREQQAPYVIDQIWDGLSYQLEDYERIGDEQLDGVAVTHYRLSDDERADAVENIDIPVTQYSADIWIDGEGNLRKVFRGVHADDSGEPTKGQATTWTLTAMGCECPVEAPAG
jgi:hypothetical protein